MSQKNDIAVEVSDLVKVYRTGSIRFTALRGVSLKVGRGEIMSILGPSGSGKTTLLNMIGLLDEPTTGKVLIDGIDVTRFDEDRKSMIRNKKIGFVFQSYNLIHRLTAVENVELALIAQGATPEKRRKLAQKTLALVGLESKLYNRPFELSAGQQQRVAISRALVTNPTIVLGDELTGNVDTDTSAQIMELVKQINKTDKRTFIIVTHNPEVARETRRRIHLVDGQIGQEDVAN